LRVESPPGGRGPACTAENSPAVSTRGKVRCPAHDSWAGKFKAMPQAVHTIARQLSNQTGTICFNLKWTQMITDKRRGKVRVKRPACEKNHKIELAGFGVGG